MDGWLSLMTSLAPSKTYDLQHCDSSAAGVAGVENVHVVSEDGSPHGPKSFVLWNPPFATPDRKSTTGLNMSHTEGRKRGGAKRCGLRMTFQKLQVSDFIVDGL